MKAKWDEGYTQALKKRIAGNLELIGEYVEGQAKLLCKVKTGNLRDSTGHRVVSDDTVLLTNSADYASKIEYEYHPFMRPAVYNNEQQILRILLS